jgi:hypothetical protein
VLEPTGGLSAYSLSNGVCTYDPIGGQAFHTFEVVPDDRFVAGTEHRGPASGGLASRVLEASDGARETRGLFDVERNKLCDRYDPANNRCIGVPAYDGYFADSACTEHIGYTPECVAPDVVFRGTVGECNERLVELRTIATSFEGEAYGIFGGTCSSVGFGIRTLYRAGDDASSGYPTMEKIQIGSGRLKALRDGAAGVALGRSDASSFFDDDIGGKCDVLEIGGRLRCGTADVFRQAGNRFTDPSCTDPLASWSRHGCDAPVPTLHVEAVPSTRRNEYPVEYRTVELWTGPVFTTANGPCEAVAANADDVYAKPGDPVDPSTFPEIVERIE